MRVPEQGLDHRQVDPGLGQRGAERVPQRVRVRRRAPRPGPGGSGRSCAARPGSAAGPDARPWPPRTTRSRWSPGVRPAGRSAPSRRPGRRPGPGVPARPCRSPAPSPGRCPHRPPSGPAPRPSAARRTASTRRSPGPATSAGSPAARMLPRRPGRGAAARGSRTRNADRGCGRARCPSSPSRCPGATRRAAAPVGIGFGAVGSRIARNANSPLTAASRRFTVAAANPSRAPPAGIASTPAAPRGVLALRQAARNRSSDFGVDLVEPPVLLGQPAQQRQQVERVAPPRPGRVVAVAQIPQVVVDQPDVIAVRAGQHPAVVPPLDPQLDHRRHETCINQQTGQRGKHPAHHGVSHQHRERLAGKRRHHLHLLRETDDRRRARRPAPTTRDRRRARRSPAEARRAGRSGKSKDSRDDLPQVVIGMAVTRDGIPVRVWCWPGNTTDSALIRKVKDDMRDWTLRRLVWVADRGFSSAANRRLPDPRRRALHPRREAALRPTPRPPPRCPGRAATSTVADNLRVKEVKVADTERFVICHNPDRPTRPRSATRRSPIRAQLDRIAQRAAGPGSGPTAARHHHGCGRTAQGRTGCRARGGRARQGRAARCANTPPWTGTCASPRAGCSASTRRRSPPRRTWTGSTCCAARTRTCRPRTSRWATSSSWRSNAAGGT